MIPKVENPQEFSVTELLLRGALSTINQSNGKIYILLHAYAFIGLYLGQWDYDSNADYYFY